MDLASVCTSQATHPPTHATPSTGQDSKHEWTHRRAPPPGKDFFMLTPFDDGRRGRGGRGQRGQNPFEGPGSHMTQMMQRMDTMMDQMMGGGGGGGDRGMMGGPMMGGSMLGGSMSSMMGGSMLGGMGSGGGGSYSCSSCCYSSSSGGPGGSVEYSTSTHGVQRPGQEMVRETQSNYRNSTGVEKIGVSRHIGERSAPPALSPTLARAHALLHAGARTLVSFSLSARTEPHTSVPPPSGSGRSFVAEREANGNERRTDNLINVQDGTSFDSEWRGNASATQINNARTQARSMAATSGGHAGMLRSALGGGGGSALGYHEPRPELTSEDRAAARAGAAAHQAQRDRMIAEAQAARHAQDQGGGGYYQGGAPPSQRASHRSSHGNSDAAMASRLAQQEARRAGMYR